MVSKLCHQIFPLALLLGIGDSYISRWSVLIDFISVTTIAGPLREDEEEIGEEFDEDEPSSDEDETIDDEDETGHEEVPGQLEESPTSVSSPSKFFADDEESDSDMEVTGVTYIAKDLKITNNNTSLSTPSKLTPSKSTSFREKFMSPKVSSSIRNKFLLTPKKRKRNESSWLNLTCKSCGNDTEYSINMGVQEEEEKFQVRTNKANIFNLQLRPL